ncbi:hypothetical protein [Hyphomonas sp.]|uniref:hypothetical protein n=1 Tax=Hyphomonas sp. TaxID=87 RepID=UPI003528CE7D
MMFESLDEFVNLGIDLRYVRERFFDIENENEISDTLKEHIAGVIDDAIRLAGSLKLDTLQTFLAYTKVDPPETYDAYDVVVRNILATFENEVVLIIPADRKPFFDGANPFWSDIQESFPELRQDMLNAARSIGLGLPAGCVFYLMRVMESAVAQLAKSLGIENVEKEWGKILADIDVKIKDMPRGEDRKKWNELRSNLWHVKECWRNDTMHPRRSYTQEQGADIYKAVRTFLKQMSTFLKTEEND